MYCFSEDCRRIYPTKKRSNKRLGKCGIQEADLKARGIPHDDKRIYQDEELPDQIGTPAEIRGQNKKMHEVAEILEDKFRQVNECFGMR